MTHVFGYTLTRECNGWWLVQFPAVSEALTEGETEAEAHKNARDCIGAALEGYVRVGRPIPRGLLAADAPHRIILNSFVAAKQ